MSILSTDTSIGECQYRKKLSLHKARPRGSNSFSARKMTTTKIKQREKRRVVVIAGEDFESNGPTPADKCVFGFKVSCSEEIIAPNALV